MEIIFLSYLIMSISISGMFFFQRDTRVGTKINLTLNRIKHATSNIDERGGG